jgi:hypothetical protein
MIVGYIAYTDHVRIVRQSEIGEAALGMMQSASTYDAEILEAAAVKLKLTKCIQKKWDGGTNLEVEPSFWRTAIPRHMHRTNNQAQDNHP